MRQAITVQRMARDWWVVVRTHANGDEETLASRSTEDEAQATATDFQQRYGTEEQPEVARFLRYEEEK